MRVTVGTQNLGNERNIDALLDTVLSTCDVAGLQEAGDRDAPVKWALDRHTRFVEHDIGAGAGRGKVPILTSLPVEARGFEKMGPRLYAPSPTAGKWVDEKWLTWVRSGGVTYANTHLAASVFIAKRRKHHAEHIRRIARWAETVDGPVVVVGDFNCRWGHRNLRPLKAAGFRLLNGKGATHRTGRRIDFILGRGDINVAGFDLVKTGSDHKLVRAALDITVPAPPTEPEEPVMSWRVARSLDVLLNEINAAAPRRSKVSDGSIGDAAHATRTSDHNPWVTFGGQGIVRARDFTHDPANGLDCNVLADRLAAIISAGAHPAARSGAYVIWNRRILSFDRRGEGWRSYSGSNAHAKHLHLSVALDAAGFDSSQPWGVMSGAPIQEDDMPYTDWPQKDREALVADLLDAKVRSKDGRDVTVRDVLRSQDALRYRTDERLKELLARDGEALAAEIAAHLTELPAARVKKAVKDALREGVE